MNSIRKYLGWIAVPMTLLVFTLSMPPASVVAAMVDTQTVARDHAVDARAQLTSLMAREDIQRELLARGIDPAEARARVAGLTDQEARRLAHTLDSLPAGGNIIAAVILITVIVFAVLVVTDITGQTNVFPFIKAK